MAKPIFCLALAVLIISSLTFASPAQEGLGEQLGRQLDEGVEQLTAEVKRGWSEIRDSVDKLEVEGRVYSRLHWDKRLAKDDIEIEAPGEGTVVLKGRVADKRAQQRALRLAEQTVGVKKVVDQLRVDRVARD